MYRGVRPHVDSREGVHTVPTKLNIDDDLLEEAVRVSGTRTKRKIVNAALHEYVARRKQRRMLGLFGKLDWDPRHNYKRERARK